jgi:hypothetical protein
MGLADLIEEHLFEDWSFNLFLLVISEVLKKTKKVLYLLYANLLIEKSRELRLQQEVIEVVWVASK